LKILADEGVDGPIVEQLRQDGHQVLYIAEMAPSLPDDEVLILANNEGAILLTADKDFGELIFRQRRLSPGVVLIRLAGLTPTDKAILVRLVVAERANDLANAFTVVTPKTIRIRR
jgi:predicted nuclease of predicted toxin-antitoxin system